MNLSMNEDVLIHCLSFISRQYALWSWKQDKCEDKWIRSVITLRDNGRDVLEQEIGSLIFERSWWLIMFE